jgi:hypothetical protein
MNIFYKTLAAALILLPIMSTNAYAQDSLKTRTNKYALIFTVPDSKSTRISVRKYDAADKALELRVSGTALSDRSGDSALDFAIFILEVNRLSYFKIDRVSAYSVFGGGVQFLLGDAKESDQFSDTGFIKGGVGVEFYATPEFTLGAEINVALELSNDLATMNTGSTQLSLGFHF